MDITNPMQLLKNFPVSETKLLLKDVKTELKEALKHGTDESGMIDILLAVIGNVEKELTDVTDLEKLSKDKQARVFADMSLILQFLQAQQGEEEGVEEEYEEDEEE